jgi:hypothetical protein
VSFCRSDQTLWWWLRCWWTCPRGNGTRKRRPQSQGSDLGGCCLLQSQFRGSVFRRWLQRQVFLTLTPGSRSQGACTVCNFLQAGFLPLTGASLLSKAFRPAVGPVDFSLAGVSGSSAILYRWVSLGDFGGSGMSSASSASQAKNGLGQVFLA